MDAIAARAGVGVGTVYRRFPEKSDLLEALFDERLMEIVALADEALERDDDPGRRWWSSSSAARSSRRTTAPCASSCSARPREPSSRSAARELLRPRVAELVRRARESGELRDDIETLDVPLIQLMVATVMDITAEVAPETWRRMLAIVIDGLRAARARAHASCRPPRSTRISSPARWST